MWRNSMPKIYAHRGGAGYFVENTLKAFEFAIELGCAGAELDVHLTQDGEIIVHHNDKLNHKFARKADGNWITPEEEALFKQLTLEKVQQYTVGEPNPKTHNHKTWPNLLPEPNQPIPTLGQVIDLAQKKSDSFELIIEIKTDIFDTNQTWLPLVDKVLDLVKQKDFTQRVKFCSFNWNTLLYIQQQAPDIPLWFTTHPISWLQEGEVPKSDIPPRQETLQNIRQAWLTGNAPWYAGHQPQNLEDFPKVIKQLGGEAWFCHHTDATPTNLIATHDQALQLATWSVNLKDADVLEKIDFVDELCVDYPKHFLIRPTESQDRHINLYKKELHRVRCVIDNIESESSIKSNWISDGRIKVSIICITFNHAKYIEAAITSFLSQKTTFPFEIIVHDDASTDGTSEIINYYADRYPDLIKPIIQKENLYSRGLNRTKFWLEQARGDYFAFCEGDDYWLLENKLQTQVDLMDKNTDCIVCQHDQVNLYENKLSARFSYSGERKKKYATNKYNKEDQILIKAPFIKIRSCLIRATKEYKSLIESTHLPYSVLAGDQVLSSRLGLLGKQIYIKNFKGSVYRVHKGGAWSGLSSIEKNIHSFAWRAYLFEYYLHLDMFDVARYFFNSASKKSKYIKEITDGNYSSDYFQKTAMLRSAQALYKRHIFIKNINKNI